MTLLDELVLARSAFHHSMNHRCVIVLGAARTTSGATQTATALERLTERLAPGRWGEVRPPNAKELKATSATVRCWQQRRAGG